MTDKVVTAQEVIAKIIKTSFSVPRETVHEIFAKPEDFAFDVGEEKFYKISETKFKTVEGADALTSALNDGWKFDKILTAGEYPAKYLLRRRNYLSSSTSL